jgi:elongator complex protein 2
LIPGPAVGGHCNQIVDACWGVDGGCLLTVSTDQTARLTTKLKNAGKWCEIARPQVHGHDFSCVTALPTEGESTRYLYVSGSEEKVLRVFEAPGAFADTLAMARGRPFSLAPSTPAYGASLPALGLSNKAIYTSEDGAVGGDAGGTANTSGSAEPGLGEGGFNEYGPDVAPNAAPTAIAGPPLEEHLAGSTLWPEIHKLYGHGNEIYSLAAHPTGRYLASACRAQSTSTAGILLWDTKTWMSCAQLEAHSLTVTQLAFSPNGKFLASASRDRTLAIFSSSNTSSSDDSNNTNETFSLVSHVKAHARIVWGVGWAPNSEILATASRDGTAKIWHIDPETGHCIGNNAVATLQFNKIGVQSVAFAPKELSVGKCLAAVGLESGDVVVGVVSWQNEEINGSASFNVEWSEVWRTNVVEKHAAAVRRVCWRVADDDSDTTSTASKFDLASVSDDHSIRIFHIDGTSFI